MKKRTFLIYVAYVWTKTLLGLTFHPYKSVRETIINLSREKTSDGTQLIVGERSLKIESFDPGLKNYLDMHLIKYLVL